MIDIVCEGGTTLYGIQMTLQTMKHLVLDGVIQDFWSWSLTTDPAG